MTLLIISSPVVVGGEIIAVGCTAAEASAIGSTAASVGGSVLLANTAGAVGISMGPVHWDRCYCFSDKRKLIRSNSTKTTGGTKRVKYT